MSPATLSPVDQLARVLAPNSGASISEKVSLLQAFSATLNDVLTLERSLQILNQIPLQLFYLGFSAEDERLTIVLCEVINKILQPFSYEQIMSEENKTFLVQGLTHFTPEIRYLSLQQVFKCLSSNQSVSDMTHSDVFPLVVATIAFQDTHTANKASDLLFQITQTTPGQEAFFGPTCMAMLKQLLQVNGTISFRVYDLLIKVATISDNHFKECEASGLLSAFTRELASDDLLLKINAIELLNEIAATPSGLSFLEKANLINTIAAVLDNTDDSDVVVQLVKCAVIKFFGNLGENKAIDFEPFDTQYRILERIGACLESSNIEILIVTVSTLGLLGSHIDGLKTIYSHQNKRLIQRLLEIYGASVGQLKSVCLQTISKWLSNKDDNNSQEAEHLTLDIYDHLEGRPSTLLSIVKEAKQPDDSLRIAAFAVMQSIACHTWGIQKMANSSEFMNYILNRTTEYDEQGQTWKYAIVQTMAGAPDASSVFANYYQQLQVYVRQGPFFRVVEPVAAVENS
ncbi:26S proteasome non-ATPase regulatory subunit 5 [Choanephora cucurbitarum]|nr:26S proteasome non-ATPase regulatory subunit 5 [Choanephora cucurbitarum]KAI8379881.1 26S proteasome non-ATPase regulatory subunit 5 [Choanephora cucurbitarum]